MLAMTYFWELAASYFPGTRSALKPTICQSLRAINMWFCHPRSFSLAFAFAVLGLGVFFFLKSLWERANLMRAAYSSLHCVGLQLHHVGAKNNTGAGRLLHQATGVGCRTPWLLSATSVHNSSVSEPFGENMGVFQVGLVCTPKFIPVGHDECILWCMLGSTQCN